MKKFLFLLMASFCMACPNAYAGCNAPTTLSYDGNQHYDDDEFLYDVPNYYYVKEGYKNTKNKTSGDGKGYECDKFNPKSCQDGNRLTLPAGHYFRGNRIGVKTTYECKARAAGNDKWEPISKDVCSTPVYGDIEVGKQYGRHLGKPECSGYPLTDDNGTEYALLCLDGPTLVCKAMSCVQGMRADNGKCIIEGVDPLQNCLTQHGCTVSDTNCVACCKADQNQITWENKTCKCKDSKQKFDINTSVCKSSGNDDNNGKVDKCKSLSGAEQIACYACKQVDASVAVWQSNQCVCKDTNKEFDVNSLKCVSKDSVYVEKDTCELMVSELQMYVKSNCSSLDLSVSSLMSMCGRITQVELNTKIAAIKNNCNLVLSGDKQASKKNIIAAGEKLDSIVAGFGEANVWKNAEGEFNTARLASDSIAGVVLGTAGGLITSSVMKKKQAEQGFEDLKCVIGGQPVAGWGDEFNVGIQ